MKLLDNFCNEFFQKFFRVSSGCPIANLYWQTGFLKVGMMILERKLNFFHHVSNLPEDSLAKEVLMIQREKNLPSVFKEIEDHLNKVGAEEVQFVSKTVWKKRIKRYVRELYRNQLLEDIKKYKKLNFEECEKEEFKRKEYFNTLDLEGVRLKIKLTSKVVPTVRTHFKRKYRDKSLRCPSCRNFTSLQEDLMPDRNSS